jgi:hypothetical protein
MLEVEILGKPLRLACKAEEKEDLLNAVSLLDEQIQEIREGGKLLARSEWPLWRHSTLLTHYLLFKPEVSI